MTADAGAQQTKDGGLKELRVQLRDLRMRKAYAQARELIQAQPDFESNPVLEKLHREHEDFWWMSLVGKRATLKRRCAADIDFVRACWRDADFMRKFNRFARPLPRGDEQLRQLLDREHASLLSELKALHWTIYTASGPVGFVSATEHSSLHRRCEFIIGFLNQRASPVPPEAANLAIGFLRERAQIERLTAFIYSDNAYAARVAAKFGFREEGILKNYVRAADGNRIDVIVFGLCF
jgi:RimJ/RimL family protein N-acetyltransferase